MGLFDKIKDNARDISKRALEGADDNGQQYTDEPNLLVEPEPTPLLVEEISPKSTKIETDKNESASEKITVTKPALEEKPDKPATDTKADKTDPKPAEKPKAEPKTEAKSEESKPTTKPVQTRKETTIDEADNGYQPHYKMGAKGEKPVKPRKLLDVTPKKPVDPVKQAIYARERQALAALANQRLMNGLVPFYTSNHMNFKTRVFIDRIEYSGSFGKNVLPIEKVAWVKLRAGGTGVIIETTEGKRVVMVVKTKDRLDFADAIMKVQTMQPKRAKFKDTKTIRIDELDKAVDGMEELEKLAKLYDRGILTQEEFDAKKKQILGL